MDPTRQNNAGCREPLMVWCTVITTLLAVLAFLGIQKYTDLFKRESQSQPQAVRNEGQSDTGVGNSTSRSQSSNEDGNNRQKTDRDSTVSQGTPHEDSTVKQEPTPEDIEFTVRLNPTNPYETGILEVTVFINGRKQGLMDTNLGAHELTVEGTSPGNYNYELKATFYNVSNEGLTPSRNLYGKGSVYAADGSSFRVAINSANLSLFLE